MKKDEIIIFTDGSSRGNPGPGGFGAIIVAGEKVVELGEEKNIRLITEWSFPLLLRHFLIWKATS